MNYQVGFATDIGLKRQKNQDSIGTFPELGLFIVSDGMGGHQGGEIASQTAVQAIHDYTKQAISTSNWKPDQVISQAIQFANTQIYETAMKQPQLQGMGTTTTALLFQDNTVTIGHAGDSRCYLLRSEALWQTTRDHSLVQEKLKAGLITRQEIKTDPMKNVITRSVGFEPTIMVDIYQRHFDSQDIYLICSDGLTGMVDDNQILEICSPSLTSPTSEKLQQAASKLIQKANENGGNDNISILIIQSSVR